MADFSAAWLALREPADRRWRSARVARAIADVLPRDRSIDILDLGSGTGSNARYCAEYFRSPQAWLLVDHDDRLLEKARSSPTEVGRHIPGAVGSGLSRNIDDVGSGFSRIVAPSLATRVMDLSRVEELKALVAGRDLVTASALLDLVSETWLDGVTVACREKQAAVLFALSYDGRIVCSPAEPEDEFIRSLVNRHQHTDKGFGPALGPDAAVLASHQLEGLGYHVVRDQSDWILEPDARELQRHLIQGWAEAATEMAPADADTIAAWHTRRLAHVLEGVSRLVVGHEDLGAFIA